MFFACASLPSFFFCYRAPAFYKDKQTNRCFMFVIFVLFCRVSVLIGPSTFSTCGFAFVFFVVIVPSCRASYSNLFSIVLIGFMVLFCFVVLWLVAALSSYGIFVARVTLPSFAYSPVLSCLVSPLESAFDWFVDAAGLLSAYRVVYLKERI